MRYGQFGKQVRPHVTEELAEAAHLAEAGRASDAFRHLERAHVLGQASTREHVRVHVVMLFWGIRYRCWKEVRGQVLRIIGAATKTALGWVPTGNTGGANISPFKPLPIPEDLQGIIEQAKKGT
ncbi:DUF3703 domain-containing protein [Sneathiella chinensis]|uniref:DUF3703 domain-containing protein n=1 Tax=Sneathiella chinensis TaxID=349750 RepID=A0ABQ5U3F1_9PROT|nr:DUF3703 domain-containing protein [Sneathiella chinensis]GLQ06253.1 hypothetical protein GCM10007924_14740 [Sneathiella chinensis]